MLSVLVLGAALAVWGPSASRALVQQVAARNLPSNIEGRWELGPIESLGLTHVGVAHVRLLDATGQPRLTVTGLRAQFSPWRLFRIFIVPGDPVLELEHLRLERASLDLGAGEGDQSLALLGALERKRTAGGTGTRAARAPLIVDLPSFELGRVSIKWPEAPGGALTAMLRAVHGRARIDGPRTSLELDRYGLLLRSGQNDGSLRVHATGTLGIDGSERLAATLHAIVQGVEADLFVEVDARRTEPIQARVVLPRVAPAQARRLIADWPLTQDLAIETVVQGSAEKLTLASEIAAGHTAVHLDGRVTPRRPLQVQFNLVAGGLDAQLFGADYPRTDVALTGHGQFRLEAGSPAVEFEAATSPTELLGSRVPALELAGEVSASRTRARLKSAGAGGDITVTLEQEKPGIWVASGTLSHLDLTRLPELLGPTLSAAPLVGSCDGNAKARIERGSVALEGQLRAGELSFGSAAAIGARVDFKAEGPLGKPAEWLMTGGFDAHEIQVAGLSFSEATGHLSPVNPARPGSASAARSLRAELNLVEPEGGLLAASAEVHLQEQTRLERLALHWQRSGLDLTGSAATWVPSAERLEGAVLRLNTDDGTAALRGDLSGKEFSAALDMTTVDVAKLGRDLGVGATLPAGTLTGHGEVNVSSGSAQGRATFQVDSPSYLGIQLSSAELRLGLDNSLFSINADFSDRALGHFSVALQGERRGPLGSLEAWRQSSLQGLCRGTDVPLWPLSLVLQDTPLSQVQGTLSVEVGVVRGFGAAPSFSLWARAAEAQLAVALPGANGVAPTVGPLELALQATAPMHGPASARLQLQDANGPLLEGTGQWAVSWHDLAAEHSAYASAPLHVELTLPARDLRSLPLYPWGQPALLALEGRPHARWVVDGTLNDPDWTLDAAALQLKAVSAATDPVDVSLSASYRPRTSAFRASASVGHQGRGVLNLRARAQWNPWRREPARTEVDLGVLLNGLPVSLLPQASTWGAEGQLFGSLALTLGGQDGLHQQGQLRLRDLVLGGQPLGNGRLSLVATPTEARGLLQVEGEQGSRLLARIDAQGSAAAQGELPVYERVQGQVAATHLRAGVLAPLLEGIAREPNGNIEANLQFDARRSPAASWHTTWEGNLSLAQGSAHLEPFGLEVHDVRLAATAYSDPATGTTHLLATELQAKTDSDRPSLRGVFNLTMDGLSVQSLESEFELQAMPLKLEGVSWGKGTGRTQVTLSRSDQALNARIAVPSLRVQLPRETASRLVDLDPHPEVHVVELQRSAKRREAKPAPWSMRIELGSGVRLSRGDLDLPVTGAVLLEHQRVLRPSGVVEVLAGGHIDFFGRTFLVDRGSVRFVPEEPDNPVLDLVAGWRAPDGTLVTVLVSGTAKEPAIETRDDAGLTESQRFELISGSLMAEDSESGGVDFGADSAALIGQTFAALGLNEFLRDSVGDVNVRVSTGRERHASYTASVRLSNKLWFEGNYQPEGTDTQDWRDTVVGVIDYRFSPNWSLRTKLGRAAGSAFDLLWSHRY